MSDQSKNDAPENWIPVNQSSQGTTAVVNSPNDAPENWVPVGGDKSAPTPYEAFSKTSDQEQETPLIPIDKDIPDPKARKTVMGPTSHPDEGFLNSVVHSAEGAAWNTVAKPILGMKDHDMDKYLSDLEKNHPIATTLGGTTPYIATSMLFPQSLLPNIYGRLAVQFGGVALLNSVGKERVDESGKPIGQKALTVLKDTAEGAAVAPVFAKAQTLKFVDRPFATALARAGIINAGTTTMSAFFGQNLAQAFKQGSILGALSLIIELPHLGSTVIGRGIVNHANDVYASMAVRAGLPEMKADPNSPDFQKQVNGVSEGLAKQIKGVDKPQIISATVRLPDGTESHGVSHDNALNKIGMTQEEKLSEGRSSPNTPVKEGKDYQAGFTVLNPDGSAKFITREEAMKEPYKIKDGVSENVPGLNVSKFETPFDDIKIVNPETLEKASEMYSPTDNHQYVKNNPLDISFGKDDKSTSARIRQEFTGIKNEQIVRGNQLSDKIKQLVPDKTEREALFWYKAAQGNNDFLLEMLSEDQMKPYANSVKKAFSLSPNAMKALDMINQYYDESGKVAMELGTIRNVRENYMNRIYKPEPPKDYVKTETRGTAAKRTTGHAKARVYDNELDAVMGGKQFATTDVADALSIHNEEMARVNTNRKLADAMIESGLGAWKKPDNVPDGWEQVGSISKSVPLKGQDGKALIGEDGNQVISKSVFVAPKGIAKGLAAIMEPNFVSRIDALRTLQKYQGLVKTVDLSLSFFHHFTMGAQVLYQGGVRTFLHIPVMDRMIKADSFAELEKDLVKHGGMTSKVEANQDVLRSLMQDDGGLMSKIGKTPVIKQYFETTDKMGNFLFGKVQRYLKVMDYGEKISNWVAKNPEATNEEVKAAKVGIGKEINAAYGGLNWEAMGMTRSNLSLFRLGLLAPDWTISNYELLKYAIGENPIADLKNFISRTSDKTQTASALSRKHILTALIGGMVFTEGINKLMTGHFTNQNKKGHELEIEISPNVYVSLLRGGIGDITKFASMVSESGLAGGTRFAQGKLSPLLRTAIGSLNNTQYTGRAIVKKGEGPALSSYHIIAYLLANAGPIPFGAGALGQYASYGIGPLQHKGDPNATLRGGVAISLGVGRYSKSKEEKEMTPYRERQKEKDERLTPLQRKTKHMTFEQVDELYNNASVDDKGELQDILEKKKRRKERIGNWSHHDEELYNNSFKEYN
jgi:hypothetical protein